MPTNSERMQFLLGDVDRVNPFLTDQEYADALAFYPDWRLATAYLADSLASRAINSPTSFTATGDMSISWTDRARAWRSLAQSLRDEVASGAGPSMSVIAVTRRDAVSGGDAEYSRARYRLLGG